MLDILITNNIRDYRKLHNWKQEDLAKITGLTVNTISALETGVFTPNLKTAFVIAYAFHADIWDIFDFELNTCSPSSKKLIEMIESFYSKSPSSFDSLGDPQ